MFNLQKFSTSSQRFVCLTLAQDLCIFVAYSRSGEMVDTLDSKSSEGDFVSVRVRPPVKKCYCVLKAGIEPARAKGPRDFKSRASTCSATPAKNRRQSDSNRCVAVLQTAALTTWLCRRLLKQLVNKCSYLMKVKSIVFYCQVLPTASSQPPMPLPDHFQDCRFTTIRKL
jgi:hypothetical protein